MKPCEITGLSPLAVDLMNTAMEGVIDVYSREKKILPALLTVNEEGELKVIGFMPRDLATHFNQAMDFIARWPRTNYPL